jgi:hypothetical protein
VVVAPNPPKPVVVPVAPVVVPRPPNEVRAGVAVPKRLD